MASRFCFFDSVAGVVHGRPAVDADVEFSQRHILCGDRRRRGRFLAGYEVDECEHGADGTIRARYTVTDFDVYTHVQIFRELVVCECVNKVNRKCSANSAAGRQIRRRCIGSVVAAVPSRGRGTTATPAIACCAGKTASRGCSITIHADNQATSHAPAVVVVPVAPSIVFPLARVLLTLTYALPLATATLLFLAIRLEQLFGRAMKMA